LKAGLFLQTSPLTKYLSGVYRLSKGALNQQIAKLNVRATQSDLLLFISDHPNLTQAKIAKANSVDPSLLAKDLQVLEQHGWVQRQANPADKRSRLVALTAAGEQTAAELKNLNAQWWQQFSQAHPEIDLAQLQHELEHVYDALRQEAPHD
jgi:DNA-binding MarR family transcriptional regulator